MIEKCSFGKMAISGRIYESDLWIFPDGSVRDSWWRRNGHRLQHEDIAELIEAEPAVIVVGTGIFGRMRIDADLESHLHGKKIGLKSARTKSAAETYNQLINQGRSIAACFHLTC